MTDSGRLPRLARRMLATSCVLALLGGLLLLLHLGIRPPCYPGYVRLLDLAPALPVVAAVVAVISGVLYLVDRKRATGGRGIGRALGAVVLLVLSGLLTVAGVVSVASDHGRYDYGCWTF